MFCMQYVLSRQSHPYPKPEESSAQPAKAQNVTITLKPMRGGDIVTLSDIAVDSTIHDVKTQYASKSGFAQDKVKLLLNKKPAADLKTLAELGVAGDVEISVMIIGGGTASPAVVSSPPADGGDAAQPSASAPPSEKAQIEAEGAAAQAASTTAGEILKTDGFWSDLEAFLSQRLRDEKESKVLAAVFKEAWAKR